MSDRPHVVALCGSLRDDSRTRIALADALDAAADAGARTTLVDLQSYDLPRFDPDHGDAGDAPELRATVDGADAVLLGSPKYHGTYASALKNALDYCGRDEFDGTTVGLLVVAGGSYPSPPLAHLRETARALGAWTLPTEVAIPNASSNVADGGVAEDALAARVAELGERLADYAGVDGYPEAVADERAAAAEP